MKRLLGIAGALLLALGLFVPMAFAADGGDLGQTGRVLISIGGDVTLPAGEQADVVVVVQGDATIQGRVNAIVVVDGTATLTGATAESLVVVRGLATLGPGTRILGDVRTLDASVDNQGATVTGGIRGLEADLTNLGFVLGPALVLLWIGFVLTTIVAGLLLVALGTRQVRAAELLVQRELGQTLLWGLAALFLPPFVAVLFILTIVGAPLGAALLLVAWPALAFVGYLFAGVMLGDWLVTRMRGGASAARPYLRAVVGIGLLQLLGIFPPVSFIASFVGMGAVLLLAWRTFRGSPQAAPQAAPWGTGAPQPV